MKIPMKFIYYCWIMVSAMTLLSSCTDTPLPTDITTDTNSVKPDAFNRAFTDRLLKISVDNSITMNQLVFDNGTSILEYLKEKDSGFVNKNGLNGKVSVLPSYEQKKLLIARMLGFGWKLTQRKDWYHSNNYTQMNGLGFKWGGKQPTTFSSPTRDTSIPTQPCLSPMYGLDASGMIYQMAIAAGLLNPYDAILDQIDEKKWNGLFTTSQEFTNILARHYRHDVPDSSPEYIGINALSIGDVVFKTGYDKYGKFQAYHVGMIILKSNGMISILNAKGSPDSSCSFNMNNENGPCTISMNINDAFGPGSLFGSDFHVIRFESSEDSVFTDTRDGEKYTFTRIGNQTWMTENLRYSGTIPEIQIDNQWANLNTPAWCYYQNNPSFHFTFGKLYNFYAVETGKLAPPGWHIPSDEEWQQLIDYLGGDYIAGGAMKSTTVWNPPNKGATNSSGFSGLPGGFRSDTWAYWQQMGMGGFWWTSTKSSGEKAFNRMMGYYGIQILQKECFFTEGLTVRCIKD